MQGTLRFFELFETLRLFAGVNLQASKSSKVLERGVLALLVSRIAHELMSQCIVAEDLHPEPPAWHVRNHFNGTFWGG